MLCIFYYARNLNTLGNPNGVTIINALSLASTFAYKNGDYAGVDSEKEEHLALESMSFCCMLL